VREYMTTPDGVDSDIRSGRTMIDIVDALDLLNGCVCGNVARAGCLLATSQVYPPASAIKPAGPSWTASQLGIGKRQHAA
jgi:hypothetical protein